jgi:hypothetical protein
MDQGRSAVEFRQDRIGVARIETDHQARDAIVAVTLEQVEVLVGVQIVIGIDAGARPASAAISRNFGWGMHVGILGA